MGIDHNLDLIKSDKHDSTQTYLELNFDRGLAPTITKPTRVTKTSATLMDNIFCSIEMLDYYESQVLLTDMSDHFACLLFRRSVETNESRTIRKRKLNENTIKKIKNDLKDKELNVTNGSVNFEFDRFHSQLLDSLNKYAPEREVVIRRNKVKSPWITRGLERSMKKCNKKYCNYLRDRTNDMKLNDYKEYRTMLNRVKRRARREYYSKLCTELRNDGRKLWKVINNISHRNNDKTSIIEEIKSDKFTLTKGNAISNCFAEYFSGVGRNCFSKIGKPKKSTDWYLNQIPRNEKSLFMTPITPMEVDRLIINLPNKTSSGYDDISNILLKELRHLIKHPLAELFNRSISEGIFPDAMKLSDTVPLYKSKERTLTTNYRPVSLLITLSKLLEKTVHSRVYEFLEHTQQLYASQYGFRKKHSCETAIAELVAEIVKNMEEKKYTLGVFLDLSKAFDTLSHEVLLKKLERYGIRGCPLMWFESYLRNRQLRVKCNTLNGLHYSDYYEVDYGTPQGSCLGPLLFLIFNNDLHRHLTLLRCILFADDTTLFKGHKNIRYLKWCVENEMTEVEDWFKANGLTLNLSKTECVLFGATNQLCKETIQEIKLGELLVKVKDKIKFLGMWLDKELKFLYHTSQLVLKLKRNQHLLRLSQNTLNEHSKRLIYCAYIQSHIQYGLVVWGPLCNKENLEKIRRLQENNAKLVNKSKVLQDLKLLTIDQLIVQELCKLGKRFLDNSLPGPIMRNMTTDTTNESLIKKHPYGTRNKRIPNTPKVRSAHYQKSYLVRSWQEFQKLPSTLKEVQNLDMLKKNH